MIMVVTTDTPGVSVSKSMIIAAPLSVRPTYPTCTPTTRPAQKLIFFGHQTVRNDRMRSSATDR